MKEQNHGEGPENPAPRQPLPDDMLTVAHIELEGSGSTLTLAADRLGDLIDIAGEGDNDYIVRIRGMKRADFEALGEFDGF